MDGTVHSKHENFSQTVLRMTVRLVAFYFFERWLKNINLLYTVPLKGVKCNSEMFLMAKGWGGTM